MKWFTECIYLSNWYLFSGNRPILWVQIPYSSREWQGHDSRARGRGRHSTVLNHREANSPTAVPSPAAHSKQRLNRHHISIFQWDLKGRENGRASCVWKARQLLSPLAEQEGKDTQCEVPRCGVQDHVAAACLWPLQLRWRAKRAVSCKGLFFKLYPGQGNSYRKPRTSPFLSLVRKLESWTWKHLLCLVC